MPEDNKPNPPSDPNNTPKVISLEEHQSFVERVRQEEKAKLHEKLAKLETLEQEVSRLSGTVQEREKALADAEKARKEIENTIAALEKSKDAKGAVDAVKLAKEVADITRQQALAEAESRSKAAKEELETRLKALEERDRKHTLNEARQQAIAELGGNSAVIESLITGNTPEEIRESAKKSAEVRKKILEDAGVSVNQSGQGQGGTPPPPTLSPAGAAGAGSRKDAATSILDRVSSMSPAEYAANRTAILEATQQQFAATAR